MAIACLRLATLLPELPLLSFPFFWLAHRLLHLLLRLFAVPGHRQSSLAECHGISLDRMSNGCAKAALASSVVSCELKRDFAKRTAHRYVA
jgi:hypothetical protein